MGVVDLQTYRETSRQTWDESAGGWEERREWMLASTAFVNEWLVDQVDPQRGQTILDLAAGLGDLGFSAAERVGSTGKVVCADFSPRMLQAARRNGESRGLSNVDTASSTPSGWTSTTTASTASYAAGATC